jgi:chemotaxis protein CheC
VNDVPKLTPMQTDLLREVTNVGAGHAATALAQLAGARISIDVPKVWIAPLLQIVERASTDGEDVVVVSMRVLGDLVGQILFVMRAASAARLLDILLRRPAGTSTINGTMERSGLQETGNILASSFLNALARWMGKILLPSVPTVAIDKSDAVTRQVRGHDQDAVLAVETAFLMGDDSATAERITGVFVFLLEGPSLEAILTALRVR